ncbi:MAG TPA: hypothetical protein VN934_00880 [Candidatus Tumulicola sp.]|nr:hypothetical protein [Candidatus Tumulicola sp.]
MTLQVERVPGFRIVVASDPLFEKLIAEVYFNDEIVAIVSEERGEAVFDLEIWPKKDGSIWTFELVAFQEAVTRAESRLRRLDDTSK